QMFERALPHAGALGLRGTAAAILGLSAFLAAHPDSAGPRSVMSRLAESLLGRYQRESTADWRWFEPVLTYDNALVPLALFRAYGLLGARALLRVARESLEFLDEICFVRGRLVLIGNDGWYPRGGV